jgi:quercetin dioxygenase-like cupin family protein
MMAFVNSIQLEAITMRKPSPFLSLALCVLALGAMEVRIAAAHEHEHNAYTAESIHWVPAPPLVEPGAQFAVLEGDPTAAKGDYTIRLKMPDGYRINPHWHPLRENVTVISGTFKVGMGDTFEVEKMAAFPAGSFAYLDPNMHHYAMAVGNVVVQVHGQSPFKFNYVNPDDDPARRQ